MNEREKLFTTENLSNLVKELFDKCDIENLTIEKSEPFIVKISESIFDWQIKRIIDLLMAKFPFLRFMFEPNEGLLIYEETE